MIKIDSVVKKYGEFKAVDQISLDIKEGEFFTLLGPSGCGKTTLLRMLAGFNTIDAGQVFFDDQVINNIPAHKRNIGMVFQNYAIFPHLSVRDNVAYGLKARKIKGKEMEQRIDEVMEMMHISPYRDRMPSQLSGGQQQRVALARAIVIHPNMLLMDEPLSNLDAKLRVQMRSSIRKIQMSLNITTIYVTHDQEEALAISDRIAVMRDGKVEQLDAPEEIYKNPANVFVANFIGTSGFLDGTARDGKVTVMGTKEIEFPLKKGFSGDVIVAVRPENAKLTDPTDGEVAGKIVLSTFLGDFISYEVELPGNKIIEINEYSTEERKSRKVGDKVSIIMNAQRLSVFDKQTEQSVLERVPT